MQMSSLTCIVMLFPVLLATELFTVTHPTYWGRILQATPMARILFFDFAPSGAPWYIERSSLDSKCRWKCLTQQDPACKTFQTYWTTNGSFYCELFNTTLCDACSLLISQGTGLMGSRVWEVKEQIDPDAAKPCAEYPDWLIRGNCSLCGKIGYYGRNCSLRSSCASYFYDPGSQGSNDMMSYQVINPCFTGGMNTLILCRGPFTLWFQTADVFRRLWTGESISYSTFLTELREKLELSSILLGSVKRNLYIVVQYPNYYISKFLYSGFSVDSDGSLTLENIADEASNVLRAPISKAPLREPMFSSCGPMWLVDPSIPHNATHIDSCNAPISLFGLFPKLDGVSCRIIEVYVDVDYFQC